jgi:hypothetical protein
MSLHDHNRKSFRYCSAWNLPGHVMWVHPPGVRSLMRPTCPRRAAAIHGESDTRAWRALQLLAGRPHGCTEADMLTHGFELAALGDLIFAGFALPAPRDTLHVMWIEITEAGRKAIAE